MKGLCTSKQRKKSKYLHVLLWNGLIALLVCTSCGGGGGSTSTAASGSNSGSTGGATNFGVTLSNGALIVKTHTMEMGFQGTAAQYLKNSLTGETHISSPGSGILDLNTQNPTGTLLQPKGWTTQQDTALNSVVGVNTAADSQRQVNMTVGWDSTTDEVVLRFDGKASQAGVRGLLWALQGFDAKGRFIIPAHSGIYFDAQADPPDFQFQYPTHWEAQFVIYESANGGVLLYARDPVPNFKHIQGTRNFGTLDLAFETYAPGPWDASSAAPPMEWRLKAFQGSWRNGVDAYKAWAKTAWATRQPDSRRDWAKNIQVVITIIDPNTDFLDMVAQQFDPAKTLIYFVNWRSSGFDANYPDYSPGAVSAAFVQYAHKLGFHVMLHANALGVATYNSLYSQLSAFQLRDPETTNLLYWPFGFWPAGPPPPPYLQSYAFISAASSAYRTTYLNQLKPLVDAVQPDALHLDAGGVLINDGNGLIEGLSSIQGMIQLHKDITNAYPQLVLGYESMTESLVGFQGFAQRWNSEYPAHPVSTYLMGSDVKFYGFLDQPNPEEPKFIDYIKRYEGQGILPTITVAHTTDLNPSSPVTGPVMRMMKLWQQYDFQPDWTSDWTGSLFRYVSKDGQTTASLQVSGNTVSLNAAGETIYERVRDTNQLDTSAFINNWTAFDSSKLYGLDPTSEYWLNQNMQRDASITRISNLPDGVELGKASLATGAYGYFELSRVNRPSFNFMQNFWEAKTGVQGTKDNPLSSGAVAQVSQTQVAGKFYQPALIMQPPSGAMLGGATFVEYQVPIPSTSSTLNFGVGLSDFGTLSDGAIFKVTINGSEVFRKGLHLGVYWPVQVDLTPWAGKTVAIRFAIHPGPALNPIDDIGVWGDINITSAPSTAPVGFSVVVPGAVSTVPTANGVPLTPSADPNTYLGQVALPSQIAVFAAPPPTVNLGQSLLNLPIDVWKQGYGGYPFLYKNDRSGQIGNVSSGGVSRFSIAAWPADRSYTLLTTSVHIPADASQLSLSVGLTDPPPPIVSIPYTGVDFSILINGQQIWEQLVQVQGWNDQTVDLTPYRGQDVLITLQADSDGSGTWDWGNWADLTIH